MNVESKIVNKSKPTEKYVCRAIYNRIVAIKIQIAFTISVFFSERKWSEDGKNEKRETKYEKQQENV